MSLNQSVSRLLVLGIALAASACSGDDESGSAEPQSSEPDSEEAGGAGAMSEEDGLDAQTPPATPAEMGAWLTAFEDNGWIADWVCEAGETEKTDGAAAIHVHGGKNRVCSNQLLAQASLSGEDQLPAGAAALKFVGDNTYVEVKVDADSDGGNGWFWYAPGGSVASLGAAECVGCHGAAGADADHPGLGDYVYFQVTE